MRTPYGRKPRQTFLGLVFLSFALVIEAHGTLVDSIGLHSVSPPKPCGVVYIAEQGGGKGWGSEIRVKQHGSSDRGAAQFQIPCWHFRVLASDHSIQKNKNFKKLKIWKSFHLISAESADIDFNNLSLFNETFILQTSGTWEGGLKFGTFEYEYKKNKILETKTRFWL